MEPLGVPIWEWERITMDFVTMLPWNTLVADLVLVIVDRLTKSAYFIPMQESISTEKIADFYIREVVEWYWVPFLVVSDGDFQFTSRFWKRFHEELGTCLHFNMDFHAQIDDQSEHAIQTL